MKAALASLVDFFGRPRSSRVPSDRLASTKAGPGAEAAFKAYQYRANLVIHLLFIAIMVVADGYWLFVDRASSAASSSELSKVTSREETTTDT